MVPGMIVGQGRYVLAEKLCDVYHVTPQAQANRMQQSRLLPPGDRLLRLGHTDEGDWPGDEADRGSQGQLVPYEGLTQAIAQELPKLPLPPLQAPDFLPAVYDFSVSHVRGDPLFQEDWHYRFGQRLGRGAFGEVWRAVALDGSMREVVLKRLFVEKGEHVRQSGEREIYFGTMLQRRPHVARFIESFEHEASQDAKRGRGKRSTELWLVFHNEGFSLIQHMFRVQPGSLVVEISQFWLLIKRQQPLGGQVIKNFAYQLLHAVAMVHDLNITHRDIKGPNVFVTDTWPPVVRLGDWGSALVSPPTDEVMGLYGPQGPTEDDETDGYKPPEVVFEGELLERLGIAKADAWRQQAYDLWSFGVLLLELILGTREVFKVDERRWIRTEHELHRQHVPRARLEHGRLLQAMLDLCLAPEGVPRGTPLSWFLVPAQPPTSSDERDSADASKGEEEFRRASALPVLSAESRPWCSDEEFADVLKQRDAAGVGLPSREGRDLLRRLLAWNPRDRILARDALAHSWFDDGAQLPPKRSLRPAERSRHFSSGAAAAAGAGAEDSSFDATAPEGGDAEEVVGDEDEDLPLWGASSLESEVDQDTCTADGLIRYFEESSGGALASGCPGLQLHAAARSTIGRRADQEDRHMVLNLSSSCGLADVQGRLASSASSASFLGIFDGHGGAAVAETLRQSLHHHLAAEPAFPGNMSVALRGAFSAFDAALLAGGKSSAGASGTAGTSSSARALSKALTTGDPGSTALVAVAAGCQLHLANLGDCRAVAARRDPRMGAGLREERGGSGSEEADDGPWPRGALVEVREAVNPELKGQRGIVVEVRSAARRLYVVRLLRDGALKPIRQSSLRLLSELRAHRLTQDHKPSLESERKRIEALGGKVEFPSGPGGPTRVAGIATSRSFGSLAARPLISAEPDVGVVALDRRRDVFVVLASDGVWDVLEDQLVVDLIWDQVSSVHDSRVSPGAVLAEAAEMILQTALEHGSLDNLTCIILLLSWAACEGESC